MNRFDLTMLLMNDEIFNTGIAHHRAIDRKMQVITPNILKDIIDSVADLDGFEHYSEEFAYLMCCTMFYELFSEKYTSFIKSHRNANPKKYPL